MIWGPHPHVSLRLKRQKKLNWLWWALPRSSQGAVEWWVGWVGYQLFLTLKWIKSWRIFIHFHGNCAGQRSGWLGTPPMSPGKCTNGPASQCKTVQVVCWWCGSDLCDWFKTGFYRRYIFTYRCVGCMCWCYFWSELEQYPKLSLWSCRMMAWVLRCLPGGWIWRSAQHCA